MFTTKIVPVLVGQFNEIIEWKARRLRRQNEELSGNGSMIDDDDDDDGSSGVRRRYSGSDLPRMFQLEKSLSAGSFSTNVNNNNNNNVDINNNNINNDQVKPNRRIITVKRSKSQKCFSQQLNTVRANAIYNTIDERAELEPNHGGFNEKEEEPEVEKDSTKICDPIISENQLPEQTCPPKRIIKVRFAQPNNSEIQPSISKDDHHQSTTQSTENSKESNNQSPAKRTIKFKLNQLSPECIAQIQHTNSPAPSIEPDKKENEEKEEINQNIQDSKPDSPSIDIINNEIKEISKESKISESESDEDSDENDEEESSESTESSSEDDEEEEESTTTNSSEEEDTSAEIVIELPTVEEQRFQDPIIEEAIIVPAKLIEFNILLEKLRTIYRHNFAVKTVIFDVTRMATDNGCQCQCGRPFTFSDKHLQCVACLTRCHTTCASTIPTPCLRYMDPFLKPSKLISNYVYPRSRPSIPSLIVNCCREIESRCFRWKKEQISNKKAAPQPALKLYYVESERLKLVRDECRKLLQGAKFGLQQQKLDQFNLDHLCGMVKYFLGSICDPLFSQEIWKQQYSVNIQKRTEDDLKQSLLETFDQMNDTNVQTLCFLLLHFKHLARFRYQDRTLLMEIFCPIVFEDVEVRRKLRLISAMFQIEDNVLLSFVVR